MTRTWLHLDDLRQFLPQEPFKEIESRMDKVMQGRIALIPEYTQEEKDERGEQFLKEDPFTINMNENGKLVTDRYFAHRNEDTINVELDLQEINTQELIGVAIAEMKKHRAFGTFYNEQSLTAEEIPEILDIAIEKLSQMRGLDKTDELNPGEVAEFSEQVTEAGNQIRGDMTVEKDENEIGN